jgi:hypothetical protein
MATQNQPDFTGALLHGFLQAGLNSLPVLSPLEAVPVEERRGRVDVLVSQIIAQAVEASGNPVAQAVYLKAKPLIDQALVKRLGPPTRKRSRKRRTA